MRGNGQMRNLNTSKKLAAIGYAALGALMFALPVQANLVSNGSFESSSAGAGQIDTHTILTDWSTTGSGTNGYNFLFDPATVSTTGSPGQYGNVALWGPIIASPDGGNFVGGDGDVQVFPLSQTINGLIAGNTYTLGFWWGAAQQFGYDGATSQQWQVSFGGQTQSTAVIANANHGFTGWQQQTFDFVATSTSEILSFLAVGTPSGVPPFALLDGVTLDPASTSVPEPGMLALLGIGLIGVPVARKLRKK
jgi:PEP-CTERM motif